MKTSFAAIIAGLVTANLWASSCTISNEFQLQRPQVLAGILENPTPTTLRGVRIELLNGKKVTARATTDNDGKYSFGNVLAGRYCIRIRLRGDPFCAPIVKCDEAECA